MKAAAGPGASPPSTPRLTFHQLPTPALDAMPPLLRDQLGPLLDQALDDGPEGLSLIERFEVREGGQHRYDLALFVGDDGAVYRKGTLEHVASFSQGGATGPDLALVAGLNAAHQAWRAIQRELPPPPPPFEPPLPAPSGAAPSGAVPSGAVPKYSTLYAPSQFELGKKLNPRATTGLLRITASPTLAQLETLKDYLAPRAAGFVVEIGSAVPLSVLAHLSGVPFVVLGPGRKSFDGLEALPPSVRRLSIRKQARLSLAALPPQSGLTSLELDTPTVPLDAPALPHLDTVGWTGAEDLAWLKTLPKLRELALRNAKVTELPASASLLRLLLDKPTRLTSLRGIESLPRLSFLRIDRPVGMQRLGSLAGCAALKTIVLVGAHAISDLSDLKSAPALEQLAVLMTKLDPAPFEALKGKLKGGSFQLRLPKQGAALLAHLGIPSARTNLLESHFFDVD